MKEGIHPAYNQTTITCACGNVIEVGSTKKDLKVVGLLNCQRAKETAGYKKRNPWNYDIEPDINRNSRRLLDLTPDVELCFINSEGIVLTSVSTFNHSPEYLITVLDILKNSK